jgi:hypothetical protein
VAVPALAVAAEPNTISTNTEKMINRFTVVSP